MSKSFCHSIMFMDDREAPGWETRVRQNRITCPLCGALAVFSHIFIFIFRATLHRLSIFSPKYWVSKYSPVLPVEVQINWHHAHHAPPLAHSAVSFMGATGVCGSLNMSFCTVAIRQACLSKDSTLSATVVEKTCNCKFGGVFFFFFLFLPFLEIQLALFYSNVSYKDNLIGWCQPCCCLHKTSNLGNSSQTPDSPSAKLTLLFSSQFYTKMQGNDYW